MKILYSEPNKVPYIEFEDGSKLIFSTLTEDKEKGFHDLSFNGKVINQYKFKEQGRQPYRVDVAEHISFMTNLRLTEIPRKVQGKYGPLRTENAKLLRKLFKKYSIDGEWITREGIKNISKKL